MMEKHVAGEATSMNRRWRRRLAGVTAVVAATSAGLIAVPAVAGASTALNQVTQGTTGTVPTAGTPVKAATADIAVTATAVDQANGDVAEIAGNQVFLLVNKAGESATDFGLGTSGTLTQGDVYLIAGQGAPGWTATTSNGSKATTTIIGKPQQVTFDSSGNLLIASNATGEMNLIAVPSTAGNYYGFTGMQAGFTYFVAGFTPNNSTLPAAPAIKLPSALTVISLSATSGLVEGGAQDVALTTSTGVDLVNFATAQTLYGVSEAARSFTQVGGGGTATAVAGSQTLNALGSGTTAFAVQSPRVYADSKGNLWVGNDGQTQGSWVLPAATGKVTIDGTSTTVTAGKAYKFSGNGISAKTTAPTSGAKANTTSISTIVGVSEDLAGNIVFLMGGSVATVTKINGAYVVANSTGKYYTQTMTAGDFYVLAGSATHALGKFKTPASVTADPSGNLWIADSNAHVLYELTGGPTGVAQAPTTTHDHAGRHPDQPAEAGHLGEVHRHRHAAQGGRHREVHGRCDHTGHGAGDNGDGHGLRDRDHADRWHIHGDGDVHPDPLDSLHRLVGHAAVQDHHGDSSGDNDIQHNTDNQHNPHHNGHRHNRPAIPKTGTFKLTVTKATVHLTRPKVNGATESSHGTLPGAQVTTTRNTVPGWTVSGQVGTFSSGDAHLPGQ